MQNILIGISFLLLFPATLICQQKQSLRYISTYEIPYNKQFKETRIGGLSGIEYISDSTYYFISDDYGQYGKPRMYKTTITYTSQGIKSVDFTDAIFLSPPHGKKFISSITNYKVEHDLYCDGEALRYDKTSQNFIWTSEGYLNKINASPFIFYSNKAGEFVNEFPIDSSIYLNKSNEKGLQHNAAFEAISFIPKSNLLVYCSEKSLIHELSDNKNSYPVCIVLADKYSGKTMNQYIYMLDDIFANNSNGITDILAISPDMLLILERAFDFIKGSSIRLYSYKLIKDATLLQKELVLDFSSIGTYIDNIEGMCEGKMIDGNKTLLFVSDNNFNPLQKTQLFLFEYYK
jgi:hypothetical protein